MRPLPLCRLSRLHTGLGLLKPRAADIDVFSRSLETCENAALKEGFDHELGLWLWLGLGLGLGLELELLN